MKILGSKVGGFFPVMGAIVGGLAGLYGGLACWSFWGQELGGVGSKVLCGAVGAIVGGMFGTIIGAMVPYVLIAGTLIAAIVFVIWFLLYS